MSTERDFATSKACPRQAAGGFTRCRHRPWRGNLLGLGFRAIRALLALVALSAEGEAQQPAGPGPGPLGGGTGISELLANTRQIREIPWENHALALLIDWAPEQKPSLKNLLVAPPAPGAMRANMFAFPQSPGRPLDETSSAASGRPALALFGDRMSNGTDLHRAEVADARALAAHPGYLRHLRCDGGSTAALAEQLFRFTSLHTLQLGPLLDDQVAASLAMAGQLESVTAGCVKFTDAGMAALGQLPSLRTLVLYGDLNSVRGQTAPMLHGLRCLRIATPLDPGAGSRPGNRELLREVVRLPNLQELQFVLERLPMTALESRQQLLAPLRSLPALRRLGIVLLEGSLSPFLEDLVRMPLTHLRLSCEELTTADVERLAGMQSLRELDLTGVQFDDPDATVANLAKMKGCKRLGIAYCNLGFERRQRLVDALPGCLIEHAYRSWDGTMLLIGESAAR
jgi:hypothetical protein